MVEIPTLLFARDGRQARIEPVGRSDMTMQNSEAIWQLVDARRDAYEALSDRVWETPEIAYTEIRSVAEHRAMLEAEGFRITNDVAGIPTAVSGEAGEDGPVIAILGEYDALPGLSQVAGIAEPRPLAPGGHGHGCGHNMLGAAALLAAAAVKSYLAERGLSGRVRYYGCPAEEGGAAKVFMVRAGLFDDVDIAITWHPAAINRVDDAVSLANTRLDFAFKGRASHAAAAPHLGRSALDAVELMNVGVNYMREHMPSDARIHYAMLDGGGVAPNVVQATAKVALGDVNEQVRVNGVTLTNLVAGPGTPLLTYPGGLFAQPSNIGTHSRDRFAVLPQADVNVGYQVFSCARVSVGYSFLYLSNVARPGNEINRALNVTRIPFNNDPAGSALVPAGPAQPAFNARDSSFWAQGLTFGLEVRY